MTPSQPQPDKLPQLIDRLISERNFLQAEHHARDFLRLRPDSPDAHTRLATVLLLAGKPDQAIILYRQAIDLDNRACEPLFNLAQALQVRHQWDQAADAYRRVTELAPDNPRAFYHLAGALHQAGRLQEALHAISAAASL